MAEPNAALPCAVCRETPEAMDGNPDYPYAADIFEATGHYGSTMFDPVFGGENLQLFICATCLTGMKDAGVVRRILHPAADFPGETVIWGSDADTRSDSPWNENRLANERRAEQFLEAKAETGSSSMVMPWLASTVLRACNEASKRGEIFDPADAIQRAGNALLKQTQA